MQHMSLLGVLCLLSIFLQDNGEASELNQVKKFQFTSAHGDFMVLQRAPAKAAVYGEVSLQIASEDAEETAPVITVTLTNDNDQTNYTIDADVSGPTQKHHHYSDLLQVWSFKALLRPMPVGGSYTVTAALPQYSNQSQIAVLRNVTFGDVWYCAGQSNMALNLEYTTMRNISLAAVQAGKYDHVRIHGRKSDMNPFQPWATAVDAVKQKTFMSFSSTCWYFAEGLTHELMNASDMRELPPIGLVHTSYGGSKIEDWLDDETLASCDSAGPRSDSRERAHLFHTAVMPYIEMTMKGWIWYQGENNMNTSPTTVLGNSIRNVGYSCLMVKLVAKWRALWNQTPGTTDPLAPFGVVALPPSGGEGVDELGTMRWAQTGGFGVLPNPSMPNTFLVQAYDQDDPLGRGLSSCFLRGCCYPATGLAPPGKDPGECKDDSNHPDRFPCSQCSRRCGEFCADLSATHWYMGPIHPRTKKGVGWRLGRGAAKFGYGIAPDKPVMGPTLAGCSVGYSESDSATKVVRIYFNHTLLAGDVVDVQDYNRSNRDLSKLEVLVDESKFCLQIVDGKCVDNGNGGSFAMEGDTNQGWVPVNIVTERLAESGDYEVTADLSSANGIAFAIRYAWHGSCCDNDWTKPCPLGSCPIIARPSGLPANPFLAKIVNDTCQCIPPQECNAVYAPADTTTKPQTLIKSPFTWLTQNETAQAAFILAIMLVSGSIIWYVRRKLKRKRHLLEKGMNHSLGSYAEVTVIRDVI